MIVRKLKVIPDDIVFPEFLSPHLSVSFTFIYSSLEEERWENDGRTEVQRAKVQLPICFSTRVSEDA